jgi:hypothetical protein
VHQSTAGQIKLEENKTKLNPIVVILIFILFDAPLKGLTGEAKLNSKMINQFTRFSISHVHENFLWKF